MSQCHYCLEQTALPLMVVRYPEPPTYSEQQAVCFRCRLLFNDHFARYGVVLVPASSSGQHGASLLSRLLARAGRRDIGLSAGDRGPVGAGGTLGLPPADLTDWAPGELMEAYGK